MVMIPVKMKAPPQTRSFSPCHACLHALPFFYPPPTLGLRGGGGAASSDPQLSPFNSRIYSSRSLFMSRKLTTSISNKKTRKPPSPRGNGKSNDIDRPTDPAAFFDENGAIEDMDGYLNYLSLEYDSVWDTKPSWCQPWTIIATGVLIITGSWFILHSAIVTSVVLSLICAWWYIFLFSYPKAYSEMIADRRHRITSGVEDTYGLGTPEARKDVGDARNNSK